MLQLACAGLNEHVASGSYSGPLYGAYLGLGVAPTPPFTELSVIGNVTEPLYTGYARQAIVWGTTYETAGQLQVLPAGSLTFQPSDAVHPSTITAVFIADALTAGNLLAGLLLPTPGVPLADATAALTLLVRFGMDYNGNWGDYSAAY